MAKVNAPLLSIGARGMLGKSIVFFPWKGINAVREYVVPANPQSSAQQTQRTRLTDAVDEWHGMAPPAFDVTAWNRLAGTLLKTMSGFNAFCKKFIEEDILGNVWTRIHAFWTADVTSSGFRVEGTKASGAPAPVLYWGKSKTYMPYSATMTEVATDTWRYIITGLDADTLYYYTVIVGTSGSNYGRTGIYQQRTLAA